MNSDESPMSPPEFEPTADGVNDSSLTESEPIVDLPPDDAAIAVSFTEVDPIPDSHSTAEPGLMEGASPLSYAVIGESVDDVTPLTAEVDRLKLEKAALEQDIRALQAQKKQLIARQTQDIQQAIAHLVQEGVQSFEQRKQALEASVEQLERRRDRLQEEIRSHFAGVSQDLAIRVQGFKDYLVGSLQDLAAAAEQLEFAKPKADSWQDRQPQAVNPPREMVKDVGGFAPSPFEDRNRRIEAILEQYRTRPDYYGPPWQLRRTFEPIHSERLRKWFQGQGGRGAIRSMGSRLQNILIAAAAISVLHKLYGDRSRALVLANSPERLGEWRRGLQDCLGISRADFGPDRGVALFESPEAIIQKAERLEDEGLMPFAIVDESEEQINLALLQFPLWLAFAPDPQSTSSYSF